MELRKRKPLTSSVAVNSLASDLSSFTNYTGGAEGASQALTRAMLGERESLKLLGIVIREEDINVKLAAKGQKDLTGNALNLAKAQATLEIATEARVRTRLAIMLALTTALPTP